MSQHFNPPPSWPVPSDWTPPEGWEPDPSWPPAPPGWQFWADDVPDPLTATVLRGSYPAVGWVASADSSEFAYSGELDEIVEPQGSRSSTSNDRIVLASVAGALVTALILVGVVIVVFTHHSNTGAAGKPSSHPSDSQTTATPTTSPSTPVARSAVPPAPPAPVVLPPGAVECGISPGGRYQHAVRGNDVTSCPFTEDVRDAVNGSNAQMPLSVDVYSPVTDQTYTMTCLMEQVITCRGGDDALVYVY